MNFVIYLTTFVLLLVASYIVFRILVRRDYREKGQLTYLSSMLELLIFAAYLLGMPYAFNPPCWIYLWSCESTGPYILSIMGYLLVATGALIAFGSMAWLGLNRSFGRQVTGLYQSGPYRFTRNPQVVGGGIMVVGIALLWPSWYSLGWCVLWFVLTHPMVVTEEEHLHRVYSEEYKRYCEQVPRYIRKSICD